MIDHQETLSEQLPSVESAPDVVANAPGSPSSGDSSGDGPMMDGTAVGERNSTTAKTTDPVDELNSQLAANEVAEQSDAFDAATVYPATRPRWQANLQGSAASISGNSQKAYSDRRVDPFP